MKTKVFCTLRDTIIPVEEQIKQIAGAGFDGIETTPNTIAMPPPQFIKLLEDHNLELIIADTISHKKDLDSRIKKLLDYDPLKIVLRSGRDDMTHDEGCAFMEEFFRIKSGFTTPPIGHETHRGTMLFTPWDTAYYLKKFEDMYLVADYSHWITVTGRLLHDQNEAISLANRRAIHIHGRIGSEQTSQVPDPTAPEYDVYLHWFSFHWDQIKKNYLLIAAPPLTFTPDYRPPPYLPTLPHTNMPIVDLWEINQWSARHARSLFD